MDQAPTASMAAAVTPLSGGWLVTLALYRAALAAGFATSGITERDGREGVAWSADLYLNGRKVIAASNAGDGGLDWIDPVYGMGETTDDSPRAVANGAQAVLMALPVVRTFLLANELEVKGLTGEAARLHLADPTKQLSPDFGKNVNHCGLVIASLADVAQQLPTLKRLVATGMHWVPAGHNFGSYASLSKVVDSHENRAKVMARFPEDFKDFQGFVPDLIAGL